MTIIPRKRSVELQRKLLCQWTEATSLIRTYNGYLYRDMYPVKAVFPDTEKPVRVENRFASQCAIYFHEDKNVYMNLKVARENGAESGSVVGEWKQKA